MRKLAFTVVLLAIASLSYLAGRQSSPHATGRVRKVLYYMDPMHPSYHSATPGVAPDCGMALVPVYTGRQAESTYEGDRTITVSRSQRHALGIRVAAVKAARVNSSFQAPGRVLAEDTHTYQINAGVEGSITETFNDAEDTVVSKEQRLASYYSPEFLTVMSGFLAASERRSGSGAGDGARSVEYYRQRLRDLGMGDGQIQSLGTTRKVSQVIDIVSPVSGVVLKRDVSPGQHFERGMSFYQIADLSQVWILAEVSQQDASLLRPGLVSSLTLRDGNRSLPAKLTASFPVSDPGGSTVKFRFEASNPGLVLRPGMVVDVTFPVSRPETLTVPTDAVVDSGSGARVYVQLAEDRFEPRSVVTGWRTPDLVEIRHGLQEGEKVVADGTFLIDSESRLKMDAPDFAPRDAQRAEVRRGSLDTAN